MESKKRTKEHLDDLFELLAPGSVIEPIEYTSNVMETGRTADWVEKS